MSDHPVLYLLPGLLCDQVTWAPQIEALAQHADIRVPSFYGFDSITGMAQSVLADGSGPIAVAGHSMGGRVALEMVRLAPERIERLALLDTGTHPARPGEAEKRQELVDIADRDGMAALAARWLPPMLHPDTARSAHLMPILEAMVCRATPDIFRGQIKALLDRPDGDAVLPGIHCPTLVACGRQDMWSPVSQHEPIAAAIPHAKLAVFEDCGHMAMMEAPEAVTAAMAAWLVS